MVVLDLDLSFVESVYNSVVVKRVAFCLLIFSSAEFVDSVCRCWSGTGLLVCCEPINTVEVWYG